MAIRNVVFDVGNVLFAYTPSKIVEAIFPQNPRNAFYLQELMLSPLWDRLDRGDLSALEAVMLLTVGHSDAAVKQEEMLKIIRAFVFHLDLIEQMRDVFVSLQQTHNVYILSNFQKDPFNTLLRENPFMETAHGRVISEEVRLAKPERAIYDLLLNTYGLNPGESLFIDDKAENIQMALNVGMKGIVFSESISCVTELNRYL